MNAPDAVLQRRFERRTLPMLTTLYRIARRLTAEPADAEDLVHDAYLKGFRAAAAVDLDDAAGCHAWMIRILINTARDRHRRDRRWSWLTPISIDAAPEALTTLPLADADPEAEAERSQFRVQAEAAIRALPPEVREVVVLMLIEGFSHRETADVLEIPEGTAASRLARGRRLLRTRLAAFAADARDEASDDVGGMVRRSTSR